MRIEIIGSIASGKTTLAKALASEKLRVVEEDLTTNPYIDFARHYPSDFGLLCQMKFLTDKIDQLGWDTTFKDNVVSDYSILTEKAYARHHLGADSPYVEDIDEKVGHFYSYYGEADLYIYLYASVKEQLERIKARGRDFEQGIGADYLERLNLLIEAQFSELNDKGAPVIKVSESNASISSTVEMINKHLNLRMAA